MALLLACLPSPSSSPSPYCDDFGPMNMACTIRFIEQLDHEMTACAKASCRQLVLSVGSGRRRLTNATMLLGCYLILKTDMTPERVAEHFSLIHPERLEDFRDATYLPADFGLTLLDCWGGLFQGKQCGWVGFKPKNQSPDSSFVSLPAIGSIGSKIDHPVSSSTPTHSLISSIEYKKAQFRKQELGGSESIENLKRACKSRYPEQSMRLRRRNN